MLIEHQHMYRRKGMLVVHFLQLAGRKVKHEEKALEDNDLETQFSNSSYACYMQLKVLIHIGIFPAMSSRFCEFLGSDQTALVHYK